MPDKRPTPGWWREVHDTLTTLYDLSALATG